MLVRACAVMLALVLEFGTAAPQHFTTSSNAKTPPATTITEQDNGRDIDLNAGDILIVKLPEQSVHRLQLACRRRTGSSETAKKRFP